MVVIWHIIETLCATKVLFEPFRFSSDLSSSAEKRISYDRLSEEVRKPLHRSLSAMVTQQQYETLKAAHKSGITSSPHDVVQYVTYITQQTKMIVLTIVHQ